LPILHNKLVWKTVFFAGYRTLYRSTNRAKDCRIRSSFWQHW
jgi:hypothetical protein